jgi:hypothetical protein
MDRNIIPVDAGISPQDVAACLHEAPASAGATVAPWI